MTVTAKNLTEAGFLPNTETTQYTAVNVRTVIDKFTVTNTSAAAVTLVVKIVPNTGTAGTSNAITAVATPMSIAANSTYLGAEVVGQILNPGDFISTLAGTAGVLVIRISGREYA